MKIYITKYALTSGIQEASTRDNFIKEGETMIVARVEGAYTDAYFHKPHWHETLEEATVQAEKMRVNKIASLQKSISKLEKKKFV